MTNHSCVAIDTTDCSVKMRTFPRTLCVGVGVYLSQFWYVEPAIPLLKFLLHFYSFHTSTVYFTSSYNLASFSDCHAVNLYLQCVVDLETAEFS